MRHEIVWSTALKLSKDVTSNLKNHASWVLRGVLEISNQAKILTQLASRVFGRPL
jgi:hypothetical protein